MSDVKPEVRRGRGGFRWHETLEQRFWSRVERGEPGSCWMWLASRSGRGYGQLMRPDTKRVDGAHRIAWELTNGRPVPRGLVVRHICHNEACCNPAHLLIGTQKDNAQDSIDAGRRPGRKSERAA